MARIRSIKPEFWTSEQIMSCAPLARLLFIGLWNFCDDRGHFPFAPRQIKALLFPSDEEIGTDTVEGLVQQLLSTGLLRMYAADGKEYLEVTGWHHQKIDRPQKPKYPLPLVSEQSSNARRLFEAERSTEGIQIESADRSRERFPKAVPPSQSSFEVDGRPTNGAPALIDPNFSLPESWLPIGRADGAEDGTIRNEVQKFVAYHKARGTRSRDWLATWSLWWSRWKEHKAPRAAPTSRAEDARNDFRPSRADYEEAARRYARNNSHWPRNGHGPEPGQSGCRCPPDILQKYGIDPKTGFSRSRDESLLAEGCSNIPATAMGTTK